ncbi:MAG: hypothetical protein AAF502_03665 [Bacteroidota bacterium]
MKTKLVLWGADAEDNKILIALQLRAEDNQVDVWTFKGEDASMDLHNRLLFEWREGKETAFPESGYEHHEMELTISESILPEHIKTDKSDLINRAKTEWHFVVLSSKLYRVYQGELDDLRDKVNELKSYDSALWETLKGFWDKVREQVRERNLSRHHADSLRDQTNKLFSRMKELNAVLNEEFHSQALGIYEKYEKTMNDIDQRIKSDDNLGRVFEELKNIQRGFRKEKLTRDLRTKMWERIDNAFKEVKIKRFGPEAVGSNSQLDRLNRRYKGLLNAIKKMENSISRDKDELKFQQNKIDDSGAGQLETQIREAKVQMINERIRSKEEKFSDMNATKTQLEKQLEQLKAKEATKAKVEEEKPKPPKDAEKKTEETDTGSAENKENLTGLEKLEEGSSEEEE